MYWTSQKVWPGAAGLCEVAELVRLLTAAPVAAATGTVVVHENAVKP